MELGFIGLGRMGGNMVARLLAGRSIRVVVHDRSEEPVKALVAKGALAAGSPTQLVSMLGASPRVVWLMLPAGEVTEAIYREVREQLGEGDILIDGANSNHRDTSRRAVECAARGIRLLGVGVSGGIVAADSGYPMMVGGDPAAYAHCLPLFQALGLDKGYALVGSDPSAGHYVKMVHNAIEYGMMQAIAEGFDLLQNGSVKGLDLPGIAGIWNHGTIVSSFLMQMTANALARDADLSGLAPFVADSGEGRWAAIEAMEHGVPFVANTYALHARYQSRDPNSLALRLLAAMRREFGGHAVKPAGTD
jgi:6-phosphogluconate dehydrogenase